MNGVPSGAFHWITLLTLLPFAGALAVLLLAVGSPPGPVVWRSPSRLPRWLLALLLWHRFDPTTLGMQFQESHAWAPSLGMAYHVGVDGLGVLMLVLSAIVVLMSLAASWEITAGAGSTSRLCSCSKLAFSARSPR